MAERYTFKVTVELDPDDHIIWDHVRDQIDLALRTNLRVRHRGVRVTRARNNRGHQNTRLEAS